MEDQTKVTYFTVERDHKAKGLQYLKDGEEISLEEYVDTLFEIIQSGHPIHPWQITFPRRFPWWHLHKWPTLLRNRWTKTRGLKQVNSTIKLLKDLQKKAEESKA